MNKTQKIEEILNLWGKYLSKDKVLYVGDNISSEKANTAISSYAKEISIQDILGLIDTTSFGEATNGIIFSDDSVYFKMSHEDKAVRFHYDKIINVDVISEHIESKVKISDASKTYFYNEFSINPYSLNQILNEIIKVIKKDGNINEYNTTIDGLIEKPGQNDNINIYEARNRNKNIIRDILNKYKNDISDLYSFYIGDNIPIKKINNVIKSYASGVLEDEVIGLLDMTIFGSATEGLIFTTNKLYIKPPLKKTIKVWYEDILGIGGFKDELSIVADGEMYSCSLSSVNVETIELAVNEIIVELKFDKFQSGYESVKNEINYDSKDTKLVYGNGIANYEVVNKTFEEAKFHGAQGHGFAAERANHLIDKLKGYDAKILGDSNIKDGADRMVNGIEIQSKYCKTGSKCISECFRDGKFRYFSENRKPMKIEVPSDMYDDAVKAMKNRISKGQVQGITDVNKAEELVIKGSITYRQAQNIAKAGTIESLAYDSVNGVISSSFSFGITSLITFARYIWNGDDFDVALKYAAYEGIKVGGVAFTTGILVSQLSKAGVNGIIANATSGIFNGDLGTKGASFLVGAFRDSTTISQSTLANSAAKILSDNMLTAGITITVLSTIDIANIFAGKISGAQFFKNITKTTGTVAGGTGGWMIGATAGSVVPVVGTIIGGIAGSIIGSAITRKATSAIVDSFIEDDANDMIKIIEQTFKKVSDEYFLTYKEAEKIVDRLKEKIDATLLKDLFASSDREGFAENILIPIVENQIKKRKKIIIPTIEEMMLGVDKIFEEVYN